MKKILFICKKNENYGFSTYTRRSSGLFNSTRFIVESLVAKGVEANIVEVVDNNCIDREVNKYKPDLVVIEALWVVPEKFHVLRRLHPGVKWFVHMHSGLPFLAQEGIAMQWLHAYAHKGVGIIANSPETFRAYRAMGIEHELYLLQNVYIGKALHPVTRKDDSRVVNIGCFGAIRPMKNHLLQAIAAIKFARTRGQFLHFHINGSRVEVGGEPVLKNLRALFADTADAELIEHRWFEPHDFIKMLHHNIDIGLQVSMTETFNVVCADYVTAGIPVVCSKEISWMSCVNMAEENCVDSVVETMDYVWGKSLLTRWNQRGLRNFSELSAECWANFVHKQGRSDGCGI